MPTSIFPSTDEEIWQRFGRFGIDYDPVDYPRLSQVAEEAIRDRLPFLIQHGLDVVVDVSFWQRMARDRYKRVVEDAGGRWRLVYLRVDPAVLQRRLADRAQRFDANAAFPITDEILSAYLSGFEVPRAAGVPAPLPPEGLEHLEGARGRVNLNWPWPGGRLALGDVAGPAWR